MLNYNAVLRKKAEDSVKKQEKELELLQDMAKSMKEQLTALMLEEMSLISIKRVLTENIPSTSSVKDDNDTKTEVKTFTTLTADNIKTEASSSFTSNSSSFDNSFSSSEPAKYLCKNEQLDLEVLTIGASGVLAMDKQLDMEFDVEEDDTPD